MKKLVISSIGKDRPGIVGAFTKVLYEYNCNIEDASMTILGSQFSMILIITVPTIVNMKQIKESLKSVETNFNLSTNINTLEDDPEMIKVMENSKPFMVCVYGSDKTGIAYYITEILARYNVNITDFNSKLVSKDVNPVYVMMLETQIPAEVNLKTLTDELNETAKKLNVELNLNEIECCEL